MNLALVVFEKLTQHLTSEEVPQCQLCLGLSSLQSLHMGKYKITMYMTEVCPFVQEMFISFLITYITFYIQYKIFVMVIYIL